MIQEYTRNAGRDEVGFDLMAGVRIRGAVDILQYDIDSITYQVWVRGRPDAIVSGELDPEEVVFNERHFDNEWDANKDPDGWNFLWPVDGELVPEPGREYVILITFLLTDAKKIKHMHIHRTHSRT